MIHWGSTPSQSGSGPVGSCYSWRAAYLWAALVPRDA